jgi:hypothetical protein
LVRLLAAKTEFKTIASKIIQHPAVTIERIKLRRRVIELSVQTTIGRGRRLGYGGGPLIVRRRRRLNRATIWRI